MITYISMLDNRDVTAFIQAGRTLILSDENDAERIAKQRKSYVYPVRKITQSRGTENEVELYASPL